MTQKRAHSSHSQDEEPSRFAVKPHISADVVIPEDIALEPTKDGYGFQIYRTDLPPNRCHESDWVGFGFDSQVIGEGSARFQFFIRRIPDTLSPAPERPEQNIKKRRLMGRNSVDNTNRHVSHEKLIDESEETLDQYLTVETPFAPAPSGEAEDETIVVHVHPNSTPPLSEDGQQKSLIITWSHKEHPRISYLLATDFRESGSSKMPTPVFGEAGVSHLTKVTMDNILPARTRRKRALPARRQPRPKLKAKRNHRTGRTEDTIVVSLGDEPTSPDAVPDPAISAEPSAPGSPMIHFEYYSGPCCDRERGSS
ncbi:hypothetical protein QBC44DRAFT_363634 [Cladorrhinum sp. PSN332]|nr:hypothetical protein QBC44DRAFT_363634 [Cladorrhinum sp. PSN332]